jgi:hypothetical protein
VHDARQGIDHYFKLYDTERLHQALGYATPHEVYYGSRDCGNMEKKELFPTFPQSGGDGTDDGHYYIQGCNLRMAKNCLDNREKTGT